MTDKIVDKLRTGAITNVYRFGQVTNPVPPYIIVKPEADALNRGRLMRVFVHMKPGQDIQLEDYVFNSLSVLLPDGYQVTSRNGNVVELLQEQDWTDIVTDNDDGTISMERRFIMPFKLF
jgi:hypothetical protein